MPLPFIGPALAQWLPTISSLASSGISALSNALTSRRAFKQDKKMFDIANQYNSPQAQMNRFSQAGLNPMLIYGNGNATQPAAQLPKYQAPKADFTAEAPNPLGVMLAYQNVKQGNAQIDNVEAQTRYVEEKTMTEGINQALKAINAFRGLNTYEKEQLETKLLKETYEYQLNAAKLRNEEQKANINRILADEALKKSQKGGVELDNTWKKDFRNRLAKQGITPNDPLWARWLQTSYDQISPKVFDWYYENYDKPKPQQFRRRAGATGTW